jgi:hypothetical protein
VTQKVLVSDAWGKLGVVGWALIVTMYRNPTNEVWYWPLMGNKLVFLPQGIDSISRTPFEILLSPFIIQREKIEWGKGCETIHAIHRSHI